MSGPGLARRLIDSVLWKCAPVAGEAQKAAFELVNESGVDITDLEWDNLIILDACRYDYFSEENHIEGDLTAALSKGAHSWEFMEENFLGQEFHDTVYVTANPHWVRLPDGIFYAVESVLDRWDDDHETVLPGDVVDATTEVHDRHPDKRLIVHFMQPHEPWIGPTMEEILDRVNLSGYDKDHARDGVENVDGKNPWQAVREGLISHGEMETAYRESLTHVLDHTEELLERLDGRSIITADHGELLGERLFPYGPRLYGHPQHVYTRKLLEVPVLRVPAAQRRETVAEEPIEVSRMDDEVIEDRLAKLGYAS